MAWEREDGTPEGIVMPDSADFIAGKSSAGRGNWVLKHEDLRPVGAGNALCCFCCITSVYLARILLSIVSYRCG